MPQNLAKMIARLPTGSFTNAVWIINNDVWQAHYDYSQALEFEGIKPTLISAGKFKVEGNPHVPLD